MSDSEYSIVTYTKVFSPFEDLSDIGSPGVDGLPMMPEDPYAYVEAALQAPPSPDYVHGLEHRLSPEYVPEFVPKPVYPKFMPPKDDILPDEEQPLYVVVSPTADSPGYISEDDDDEDEEESSRDEADDEKEDEDEDEEEHPALADSVPPLVHRVTARMTVQAQTPISLPSETEVARLLDIPTPPPSPLSLCPTYLLRYRSAPLPTSSPPLLLLSTNHRVDVPEVTLPLWKRLCIALGPRFKVGENSSAPTARPTEGFRADYGFIGTLDDEIRRDPERGRLWDYRYLG
nr:hypothetical protein [Tanacetum cinerariifolium]